MSIELMVLAPIKMGTETYTVTDTFVDEVDGTEYQRDHEETREVEVDFFDATYTSVKFGRRLPDSQAYSIRLDAVKDISALLKEFPDVQLIGAWHVVGPEKTQSFRLDKDLYISVMPDDVTRDAEGKGLSRARPTVLRNVSLWGAQKDTGRDLT